MLSNLSIDTLTNIVLYLPPKYYLLSKCSSKIFINIDLNKYLFYTEIRGFTLLDACKLNWLPYINYYIKVTDNPTILQSIKYSCLNNNFEITKIILDSDKASSIKSFKKSQNRENLVNFLCKNGKFKMIVKLYDYFKEYWYRRYFSRGSYQSKLYNHIILKKLFSSISFLRACENGNIELVNFLIKNNITHKHGIESAIMNGNFKLIKYLHKDMKMEFPTEIINTLIIYADDIIVSKDRDIFEVLDMLEYLFENSGTYNDDLLLEAKYCPYSIIEFILNNMPNSYTEQDRFFLLEELPFDDKPYITNIMIKNGFIITPNAINENCRRNNYYNVMKMLSISKAVNEHTLEIAVSSKNIRLIKLILSVDKPIIKKSKFKALYEAQVNEYVEIQEIIHESIKKDVLKLNY